MTPREEVTQAAARLLVEFGDVQSAERAAGARIQTACNASERVFWDLVRRRLCGDAGTETIGAVRR